MTSGHNYFPAEAHEQPSNEVRLAKADALVAQLARVAQRSNTPAIADTQPIPIHEHELSLRASSYTVACEAHPERNEDNYFVVDKPGAVLAGGVFDGLGGQPGSERAAQLAADTVNKFYDLLTTDSMRPENATLYIEDVLMQANRDIHADEGINIGTTAAVASIHTNPDSGERFASIAWAGDSRVYIIRNGHIIHRTLDDGAPIHIPELDELYANEAPAYRTQAFLESVTEPPSGELRLLFRYRNMIDNFMSGNSDLQVHTVSMPVEPGDIILASSDGIHDNLTNAEIITVLQAGGGARELVDAAVARSQDKSHVRAKRDDMTAVVLVA